MVKVIIKPIYKHNSEIHYRVVAKDTRSSRDGKFLENLGSYQIRKDKVILRLNTSRLKYWLSVGAQLSSRLNNIISESKIVH